MSDLSLLSEHRIFRFLTALRVSMTNVSSVVSSMLSFGRWGGCRPPQTALQCTKQH